MQTGSSKVPGYRLHKASGRAIVKLSGKVHYLGKHGSHESKSAYARLIARWSAGEFDRPARDEITIVELVAAFRRFAVVHYRKNGQPTGEVANFDQAVKPLILLYGDELVQDFGPLKLKAVRALMVKGFTDRDGKHAAGLSRKVVNRRVGRIKRIFRWAESEELAPASLWHALSTVDGLQRDRTDCRETEPIKPVADQHVEAPLPFLPDVVADMVRIHRLSGCRPGEICSMRPVDVDRSATPWLYRPDSDKTEHHGRERVIYIGPRAQAILRPYLLRDAGVYRFSPADSERKRRDQRHAGRKVPLSCGNRPGHNLERRPKVRPSERYTKDSYARAVRRACDQADRQAHADHPTVPADQRIVPRWSPNQLRHAAATEIRRRFGLEAAQVCLGHSTANVSQIYAERDASLGLEAMSQIG